MQDWSCCFMFLSMGHVINFFLCMIKHSIKDMGHISLYYIIFPCKLFPCKMGNFFLCMIKHSMQDMSRVSFYAKLVEFLSMQDGSGYFNARWVISSYA